MRCPKCQLDCAAEFDFCPRCATPLQVTCPKCGFRAAAEFAFCPACGGRLRSPKCGTILQQER